MDLLVVRIAVIGVQQSEWSLLIGRKSDDYSWHLWPLCPSWTNTKLQLSQEHCHHKFNISLQQMEYNNAWRWWLHS